MQAELQDSVKELAKTRKKYQETETMAQAVRDKAEQDAKYVQYMQTYTLSVQSQIPPTALWRSERIRWVRNLGTIPPSLSEGKGKLLP